MKITELIKMILLIIVGAVMLAIAFIAEMLTEPIVVICITVLIIAIYYKDSIPL